MEVKVHGGVHMLGRNSELKNIELEELAADPIDAGVGRIWMNTTEHRIKFVSRILESGQPEVISLASNTDVALVQNLIVNKADKSTTLAGYGILDAVTDTDARLVNERVKVVRKNPGKGQYNRIIDALNSITDASEEVRYLIDVHSGIYAEPPIVLPRYVRIKGAGLEVTRITPTDPTQHFITGNLTSGVAQLSLAGPTDEGVALLYLTDPTGSTTNVFRCENLRLGGANILALVDSGFMTLSNIVFGEARSFTHGFIVRDNGITARMALRQIASNGMTAPYPICVCEVDGPNSQMLLQSFMARASNSATVGSGIGVGAHARNGGRFRMVGASFVGFDTGIWVENAGAAPTLEAVGVNLTSNNTDLRIEHPGTRGNYLGSAMREKVVINTDVSLFTAFYSDVNSQGIVNVGPLYIGKTHNTVANIEPLITRGMQTGLLNGGVLSRGVGLSINVAPGTGYVKLPDGLRNISWNSTTVSLIPNTSQYIYVDATGAVKVATALPDSATTVILGRTLPDSNQVLLLANDGALQVESFNPNIDKLFRLALGPMYVSGSIVTANASTPGAIDVTAGRYFYSTLERLPETRIGAQITYARVVSGQLVFSMWSTMQNTVYRSGGVEIPLTAGYYLKHTIYTAGTGPDTAFILGHADAQYATLDEAIAAPNPKPLLTPDGSPVIAAVIMQQGNPNVVKIIDIRPRVGALLGAGANVAQNHGDLVGLGQDDHTQYLRTDGTRPLLGNMNFNNYALTNVGSVNGLNVSAHASRHLPNGADPLATAAAVSLTASSANAAGVSNSLARSDHTHQITGFQPTNASLTALLGVTATGILKRTGTSTWSAGALAPADIPALDWSKITTGKPTTLAGYGITDAVPTNVVNKYRGNVGLMSGTTTINMSNSAPTVTQGTLLFSRTVTPKDAASTFLVRFDGPVDANVSSGGGGKVSGTATVIVALFRSINGGAATFLGFGAASIALMDNPAALSIAVEDAPNTTLPVTYSARIGINGASAWYLGRTTSFTMGGNNLSAWSIAELRPN